MAAAASGPAPGYAPRIVAGPLPASTGRAAARPPPLGCAIQPGSPAYRGEGQDARGTRGFDDARGARARVVPAGRLGLHPMGGPDIRRSLRRPGTGGVVGFGAIALVGALGAHL